MKKILALLLAALMALTLVACGTATSSPSPSPSPTATASPTATDTPSPSPSPTPTPIPTPNKTTEAVQGTPKTMDGTNSDPAWATGNTIDVNTPNANDLLGKGTHPTTTAQVTTLWDDKNLYIYASVKLDHPLKNDPANTNDNSDSIEFDIDLSHNTSGTANVGQGGDANTGIFRIDSQGNVSGQGDYYTAVSANVSGKTVVAADGSGYTIALTIPWSSGDVKFAPAAGMTIGFDVQINNASQNAGRDGLVTWNDPNTMGWSDSSALGTLTLS